MSTPQKILLINPWAGEIFPPPSLGYLQAVIKQAGHDVTAIDMTDSKLTWAAVRTWDMVCVSFHSFSVQHARKLRSYFRGLHLVCGGHHPSALPQQMLDAGYDQVVTGEGENAIIDIINGNTNKVICGTASDLDALPFPDYTGFAGDWSMGVPVISSRGCPYTCSFCASAHFWGRHWRPRSADNVLAEVMAITGKHFMFEDDNFTIDRRRALDICAGIRQLGGYSWQCASRAETLADDELCWALRSAGCHTVWLGIESLSERTLERCKKRTTVPKMLAGITTAHKHGLDTMSQFIVGLPDDTLDDIRETAANITRSKIGRKGCNVLWVLPNTDVYTRAKAAGFDDETYLRSGAPFYTYEQDINTLNSWANIINNA